VYITLRLHTTGFKLEITPIATGILSMLRTLAVSSSVESFVQLNTDSGIKTFTRNIFFCATNNRAVLYKLSQMFYKSSSSMRAVSVCWPIRHLVYFSLNTRNRSAYTTVFLGIFQSHTLDGAELYKA